MTHTPQEKLAAQWREEASIGPKSHIYGEALANKIKGEVLRRCADQLDALSEHGGGGEAVGWADLPWRAATGWLRSASGSKIIEVGDHDGCISQRESELIAAAVNAYTNPPTPSAPDRKTELVRQAIARVRELGAWDGKTFDQPLADIMSELGKLTPSAPVGDDALAREVRYWLDHLPNAVRVCEGGGPEDLAKSFAVNAAALSGPSAPVVALRLMVGAATPVAKEIDPRGYSWSEAYLDEALPVARAALSGVSASVMDETTAFKAWVKSRGGDVMTRDGEYVSSMTRLWWECWQARAALSGVSAPVGVEDTEAIDMLASLAWSSHPRGHGYTECIMRRVYAALGRGALTPAAAPRVEERCESGDPDCGPVEFHDDDDTPLCRKCYEALEPETKTQRKARELGIEVVATPAASEDGLDAAAVEAGHITFRSMKQCADAWLAVNSLLHELVPDWTNNDLTGREAALAAIRRLAASGQGVEDTNGR